MNRKVSNTPCIFHPLLHGRNVKSHLVAEQDCEQDCEPDCEPHMRVIVSSGVPQWIVGLYKAFAEWLLPQSPCPHNLKVYLYPRTSIPTHDGRRCVGYFNENTLEIGLACWFQCSRDDWDQRARRALDNFAHEYIHYERFRDGRTQNHRGLNRRVAAVCCRFEDFYFA
jgi:hypothetical protein